MNVTKIVFLGCLITLFSSYAFSVTLDTSGTGSVPDYYTCTNFKLKKEGAGGKEPFVIQMTGLCGVHPGGGLSGWTAFEYHQVSVYGTYRYSTQKSEETVRVNGQVVFQTHLSCSMNPWAYGPYVGGATCSPDSDPVNNTSAEVDGPYPLSAKYLDYSTKSAIAKAEDFQTPEEMLKDWNPYEQTGGESALIIKKPASFEMINQNAQYVTIATEKKTGFPEMQWIAIQIEHLEETPDVVGDIAIPQTYSHWWQPFWNSSLPVVSEWPIGISNGLFNNKIGQFRFRVRATEGLPNKTAIGGWTTWRHFCIGETGETCGTNDSLAIVEVTEVLKKTQAASFFVEQTLKENNATKLEKKEQIFKQLSKDKPGVALQNGKTKGSKLSKGTSIKKIATTGKLQPTIKPLPGKESSVDVKSTKSVPKSLQKSHVSSRYTNGVLTIHLINGAFKKPGEAFTVKLVEETAGKEIWSRRLSFSTDKKMIKLHKKDLNLKSQPKRKLACVVSINDHVIGKVFVNNQMQLATNMDKPQKQGHRSVANGAESGKRGLNPTILQLKPQLTIKLALKNKSLKAGSKANISISVKNIGKGSLEKFEQYFLQCTPDCPFDKSKGKFNKSMKSGESFSFDLISKELDVGDYLVKVKTKYGSSNKLSFKVVPEIVQRKSADVKAKADKAKRNSPNLLPKRNQSR